MTDVLDKLNADVKKIRLFKALKEFCNEDLDIIKGVIYEYRLVEYIDYWPRYEWEPVRKATRIEKAAFRLRYLLRDEEAWGE